MKVMVVHSRYQQAGGEDAVVANEVALLRDKGHTVVEYIADNHEIRGLRAKIATAFGTVFSMRRYRDITRFLRREHPDVVHVHNFFPLISPAVFFACNRARTPVVMTLHNYRIVCPTSVLMFRDEVTLRSLTEGPWWAVRARTYRGSAIGTFVLASMIWVHRRLGTWSHRVDGLIALTSFAKSKFVEFGLPASRIHVKGNFCPDAANDPLEPPREGFLFVGRLSPEKGVHVLSEAARRLPERVVIRVAGDGPAASALHGAGRQLQMLGRLDAAQVREAMRRCIAVVMPSIWFEGFPMVLAEAYALGVPVVASDIGALSELVEEGCTGLLFPPGDGQALARRLEWAASNPQAMREMGARARERYLAHFSPEINYQQLMTVYKHALDSKQVTQPGALGGTTGPAWPGVRRRVPVLGQPIDALGWGEALQTVMGWARRGESRYVCFANAHATVTAQDHPPLARALETADLAAPDGAPVAWMLRHFGAPDQPRISGPDFMLDCCDLAAREGLPIYLYGATEETLERLRANLVQAYPGLRIAGTHAPPFRPLTDAEDEEAVCRINQSGARLVWVGLGCPKQELWMAQHRDRVQAVMLGVGAAFDFHAGLRRRAPAWMQRAGLEWLHRFASEPRRLAWRYLVTNPRFIWGALRQMLAGRP